MMILDKGVKKDILKNSEQEILKLNKEKDLLELEIDNFNKQGEWIDWISKYQKRLSKEGEKDKKEQREFLMGVIDRIMITIINKKEHQLDIHYKLPIVGDKYGSTKKTE